ncbi:TIMELESS-interacting protein-like isoform X2 [Asterias rubens]|uniref:TIMELESS-interacting protein-like isoform X2 n=1 Tax=Asterias rubens TaxID=7604 RepID=UPI0014559577|nr:TIMELESS-interacting protein-like isoform X2 [Asterias rubens]
MQSISLDMDDIHGARDGYMSGEEFPTVGGSLPPLSPNRNIEDPFGEDNPFGSGGGSDGDKENQGDGKRPRKLVMRKPQPKLDATRLCSDRGLPTLSKHFEQVKFKGKGHEVGDLNRLMSTMEHWAHRLFPKMPFDEVIERIEKLGRKKPVQTCIKKIRMDMPLMDEDFEGDEEGAGDTNVAGDDDDNQEMDSFSQLAGPASQTTANNSTTTASLSEEQKDRIERNKRLAMERRKSKGPTPSSQVNSSGITAEEMLEMEGGHANEAEVEDQLWNDIAMFEVSQRNIWKKSPEKVAKNLDAVPDPLEEVANNSEAVPNLQERSQTFGETLVVENGQSDYMDLTVDSATEVKLIKPKEASDVIDVDSEEVHQDAAEDADESAPSDLNLKWDSESADESMIVQEPCENPSEQIDSGETGDAVELDGNDRNCGEDSESTGVTVDQNATVTSIQNLEDFGGNDVARCTTDEAKKGTVISIDQKKLETEEAMDVE